jgi:hypothetical protein
MNNQVIIERLQSEAKRFLKETKLLLNGVFIQPKEIEVYYYKEGEFEDTSVHRNDLQKKNKNHFYVHRKGTTQFDKYKGGNWGGLDFVVSDSENIYYSYLIRSALIDNNLPVVTGPHRILENILNYCKLDKEALECAPIKLVSNADSGEVLFSERINLGKNAGQFSEYRLRAVLCDDLFRTTKYPAKETLVVNFLMDKVQTQKMTKEQAKVYAKQKLGYTPSIIQKL